MPVSNIFDHAQPPALGERFDELLRHRNLVIERIVSSAAITPTEYNQAQDEWVLLVQGEAELELAGQVHALRAGDHLFVPAGVPHTVLSASHGALWLAVHHHQPKLVLPSDADKP